MRLERRHHIVLREKWIMMDFVHKVNNEIHFRKVYNFLQMGGVPLIYSSTEIWKCSKWF